MPELIYYKDITKEWLGDKPISENIVKMYNVGDTYTFRKNKYKVDGHFIKYSFDEGEKDFALWLSTKTNKTITLMPKIEKPENIRSPDFKINHDYYDLKTIHGNSRQVVYHKIKGKYTQATKFFFDVLESSQLTLNDLIFQINELFKSTNPDRSWVELIGIRYQNEFIILKRLK